MYRAGETCIEPRQKPAKHRSGDRQRRRERGRERESKRERERRGNKKARGTGPLYGPDINSGRKTIIKNYYKTIIICGKYRFYNAWRRFQGKTKTRRCPKARRAAIVQLRRPMQLGGGAAEPRRAVASSRDRVLAATTAAHRRKWCVPASVEGAKV